MFVVNLQTCGNPVDSVVSRISFEGGCTPEGFGEKVPGVLIRKIKKMVVSRNIHNHPRAIKSDLQYAYDA